MERSYYSSSLQNFLKEDSHSILGKLTMGHGHELQDLQRNAWVKQIEILKDVFPDGLKGHVFFEFTIPRMGKRVDNIVIIGDLIFVLEFKVGDDSYKKQTIDQVTDYCLDLKNFHEGSHFAKIIPVVVSTEADNAENVIKQDADLLFHPLLANKHNLYRVLDSCFVQKGMGVIDPGEWENSLYKPTPTIIEAAQALYKKHDVKEISRSDGGAINLSKTSDCISEIIDISKKCRKKSICFVTGVPGAGKTLAGLNIANIRNDIDKKEHAVFLSGNGPLVDVLREALTRDRVATAKEKGERLNKRDASREVKPFIQNIHHFRDDNLTPGRVPIEKVVVFDEAQRAWTRKQASAFMRRKKGIEDFGMSEPKFLVDVMNRHDDWCTVVCLIGGGQEINIGEAGLEEWVDTMKNNFQDWDIYYSNLVSDDSNYLKESASKEWLKSNGIMKKDLHLAVSVRSFRSEQLSNFVQSMLSNDRARAQTILVNELNAKYPIVITRNLSHAKKWLKEMARGNERIGLIASAGGKRLRPDGIDVNNIIKPPIWFLNDKSDVRSSYFLEEAATEFDIQGLELDWICVCWDSDLYRIDDEWEHRKFKGTKWQNVHQEIQREYLTNAYRVLLTRARQGMVIFVPNGAVDDETRDPVIYDGIYDFLKQLGLPEIAN